ncbi:MAG: ATP-binding protein [Candidatus Hatepunaea meridiana]|nr:ATP-binding protein [Candidatus Hatepunaea meridiana]
MISSIRIQGFKSIVDQKIDLGLFNVLIGANGCGKTNILEAIGVLSAAAYGSIERESLRYRGVRPGKPTLYKSSFKGKRFRRYIKLEAETSNGAYYMASLDNPIKTPTAKWGFSHEELKESGKRVMTRAPGKYKIYSDSLDSNILKHPIFAEFNRNKGLASFTTIKETPRAKDLINQLDSYAIYTPITEVLRSLSPDRLERAPIGLSGGGLAQAISEIENHSDHKIGDISIGEILEFTEWTEYFVTSHHMRFATVSELSSQSKEPPLLLFMDKYMRSGRNILNSRDVSEGVLYVLFIIVLLCHPDAPKFLSIDNFDQTMHPRLSRAISEFLTDELIERNDRQFIVTTHNPLALDGLDISDDRIRLFAVERNDFGATEIRRIQLSDDALKLIKDDEWVLSQLWVEGMLGGVPELI